MNKSALIPAAAIALLASLALGATALAEPYGGKGEEKGHHMMPGMEMYHGGHHGNFGGSWKDSLTAEQKAKLDKLKVDFMKVKLPLKARIKTIKMDLAVLAVADAADQKAIDTKIDALLALKKELMKATYAHKIAVRKELTAEQKVQFDQHQLKKATMGGCRGGGRHGRH